jgi:hypothetical protein
MRTTTRQPRKNRTITVDFRDKATYVQLHGDGKALLACVLACMMAPRLSLVQRSMPQGVCTKLLPLVRTSRPETETAACT